MKKRTLAAPFVVTLAIGGCAQEEIHRNPPPLPPVETASAPVTVTTNAPATVSDAGGLKRAVPSVMPPTQNPPPPKPSL